MKLSEALDFVTAHATGVVMPIHEGLLSGPGNGLVDAWTGGLDTSEYRPLALRRAHRRLTGCWVTSSRARSLRGRGPVRLGY